MIIPWQHTVIICLVIFFIFYFTVNGTIGKIIQKIKLIKKLLKDYRRRQLIAYLDPVNGSTEILEEMYDTVMEAIEVKNWQIRGGEMTEFVRIIMNKHHKQRREASIMELDWSKLHHLRENLERELDLRYQIQEGRELGEIQYHDDWREAFLKRSKEDENSIQAP
ncbi:MAG: hypothetical protein KAS63_01730 [Candidatus Heimdallarchaeota archaeon]|nr:hypothetical protein [Candidatus Heimdallarchaeota archaeon]MCK4954054.1 hypothetical protein [Candidatus Heimdallarchaeota archaeon]